MKQVAHRRENLRDSTKRAVDLVETMRRNIKDKKTEDLTSETAELSEVLVALGVGDDQGLLGHTVSELTNYLDKLALILQNTVREVDAHSREQYDTDEQIVARVSAGQALCGVSLGMGANGLSQQPTRRLLRAPLYCPLLSPSESVKMTTVTFSSVSAADAFRSAVSSSGDSLTAALEASAWGLGSVKTSATRSKQTTKAEAARQRRRAALAVAMTYGLVPVKSLHIPREQMKMSTEAADAILAIATPENARRFLADFGSHVPTGIQHLGGIYWKIVEIHAEDEVDESVMLEALAKETGGSHSTKLDIFVMGEGGGSVGRGYFSESREASGVSTSSKSYTVTTRIECVGPNVASFDMFSRVLAVNNKFWFLINRGSPRDLVPVWDLIDDSLHSDLEAMARIKSLLRDAWLDSAQHMPFTPDVRRMVYQERLARNSRSEPNRLLSANKVEARRQVEAAV